MNPLEIYFAILVHFDIVYVQGLSNREGMSSNSAVTLFHSALSLQSPYNIYDNEIIGIRCCQKHFRLAACNVLTRIGEERPISVLSSAFSAHITAASLYDSVALHAY